MKLYFREVMIFGETPYNFAVSWNDVIHKSNIGI